MYEILWDKKNNGILLVDSGEGKVPSFVRPVFHEEIDLFGFDWNFRRREEPFLWAVGRTYYYKGVPLAKISGGGFFGKSKISILRKKKLKLEPINLEKLIEKNYKLMEATVHAALEFIIDIYDKYHGKVDEIVVAFSGGKDSLVVLDLVQRVLAPDDFIVVFNDTRMELSVTYRYVDKVRKLYSNLRFYITRYDKPAITMWKKFGPPSRVYRWCCTVFKTIPTINFIREITGKKKPQVLLFDGIRRDESNRRMQLSNISQGKYFYQINVHPILNWNSAMVYLYIFMRHLPLNKLYRYGLTRIGCAVCPFKSMWDETILWKLFRNEIEGYIDIIREYVKSRGVRNENEIRRFIREGRWKLRADGQAIQKKDKVVLYREKDKLVIQIENPNKNFFDWAKVLGPLTISGSSVMLKIDNSLYRFRWEFKNNIFKVILNTNIENKILNLLRTVAYKAAYCIGCGACEIECPTGAITINNNGNNIYINENNCINCYRCLRFANRGCLVADSRKVSVMVKTVNFSRYKTFGMKTEWLKEFFEDPNKWWTSHSLGPIQFEAMKYWLIDAEILTIGTRRNYQLTQLGNILRKIGCDSLNTWGIIWTNLARNSILISWYINNLEWGRCYTREKLMDLMDLVGSASQRTKKNGISSLANLLSGTPLGKELQLGILIKKGKSIKAIEKVGISLYKAEKILPTIIYSLYRYAEKYERYHISLSQLYYDQVQEGPYKLFGIHKEDLKKLLILAKEKFGSEIIDVEFIADLENIILNENKSSLDILKYILNLKK